MGAKAGSTPVMGTFSFRVPWIIFTEAENSATFPPSPTARFFTRWTSSSVARTRRPFPSPSKGREVSDGQTMTMEFPSPLAFLMSW